MIDGLTAEERYTIDFSCDLLMGQLERVHSLLVDMWEEHFAEAKPHPLTEYDVDKIGNQLYLCTDAIFDILREYALMMGNMDFPGVGPYLKLAHRAEQAAECDTLISRAQKLIDGDRPELREQIKAVWNRPDAEAIPALRAILNEK